MKRIVAATTGAAVLTLVSAAAAERPFTEKHAQVSAHFVYGVAMDDDDTGGLNPYGVGLGARVGYTFDPNIYVGGLFDFYFGETDDASAPLGFSAEASANLWLLQGEVGYDFGVSRSFVLRPKVGLGMAQIMMEGCATAPIIGQTCTDDTEGRFAFALGLEAPIDLDSVFIAPEIRFNLGEDIGAFIMGVGVGAAF